MQRSQDAVGRHPGATGHTTSGKHPGDWRLVLDCERPGALNMALDEVLTRACAAGEGPVLRLYGWSRPTLSLGRNQELARAADLEACEHLGVDVVRRPSGGHAVLHEREITYALSVPASEPLLASGARAALRRIADAIALVCGVWVGFDQKQSLGPKETGSRAALPIWVDFFKKILAGKPREHFMKPRNVAFVPIDRETGLRASVESGCKDVILEAFARGSEPTTFCSAGEHFRQTLPYFLQEADLTEEGALQFTPQQLLKLLVENPARISLSRNHRSLLLHAADEVRELPLVVLYDEARSGLQSPPQTFIPSPERPVGVDGHIAVAVEVRSN